MRRKSSSRPDNAQIARTRTEIRTFPSCRGFASGELECSTSLPSASLNSSRGKLVYAPFLCHDCGGSNNRGKARLMLGRAKEHAVSARTTMWMGRSNAAETGV